MIKRIFDLLISILLLIVLLPIILLISIIIKLDSKGKVVFKQLRIGKDGREFYIYKFRTMIENAQNMGTGIYSFKGDPRITKVGYYLRKTSLDEILQLLNIIKGDMSIVGPRPPVVGHFPNYDELNEVYKKRFSVFPGVTGLAQIIGRNDFSWDEKIKYDNLYVDDLKKYGILLDIKIIILTIIYVLKMKNIEEKEENLEKNNNFFRNDN